MLNETFSVIFKDCEDGCLDSTLYMRHCSSLTRWISRLWRKIVDQLDGQWEARKRSLFWRDPQLTRLLLTNVTTDVDKTGEVNSSRNLVAQCHKLERAWKHNEIFARKAFESIPLSVSLDSLHDRLAVGLNDGSVELFEISTDSKLWVKTNCHSKGTLFENYSKCRIWIFEFWHFPPICVSY